MAEPSLPARFDCVVVGTGLTESLLAGACARAGKSVLHLDSNAYYGSRNATFNLQQLCDWLEGGAELDAAPFDAQPARGCTEEARGGGPRIAVRCSAEAARRVSYVGALTPPAELLAQSHRFNLDLVPQLLLAAGPMVEVLRSSGVANYIEFKPIAACLCGAAESAALQRVPCGKADIFQSKEIPLLQKRQLMKFMTACLALQQAVDPCVRLPPQARASPDAPPAALGEADGTFTEFAARAAKLSPDLTDLALYGILQLPRRVAPHRPGPSAADGIRMVCRHMRSIGVYGPTAYLTCLYGSSELPQAFCRLCAVWGGTYMLQRRALELELSADGLGVEALVAGDGVRVGCDWLVLNAESQLGPLPPAPPAAESAPEGAEEPQGSRGAGEAEAEAGGVGGTEGPRVERAKVQIGSAPAAATARCVCVLDGPLIGGDGETLSLVVVYPRKVQGGSGGAQASSTVFALQLDGSAGASPKSATILHLSAEVEAGASPRDVLQPALDFLLAQHAEQSAEQRRAETGVDETLAAEQAVAAREEGAEHVAAEQVATEQVATEKAATEKAAKEESAKEEVAKECQLAGDGAGVASATVPPAAMAEGAKASTLPRPPALTKPNLAHPSRVLWGAFFLLPQRSSCVARGSRGLLPSNLLPVDDASLSVGCEAHVEEARRLFERICPGRAFLPSADAEPSDC